MVTGFGFRLRRGLLLWIAFWFGACLASAAAATPHQCSQETECLSKNSGLNLPQTEIARVFGETSLLAFLDGSQASSFVGYKDVQVGLPILCRQEPYEFTALHAVSDSLESSLGGTSVAEQIQIEKSSSTCTTSRQQGEEGQHGNYTWRDRRERLHHVFAEDAMDPLYPTVEIAPGGSSRTRRDTDASSCIRCAASTSATSSFHCSEDYTAGRGISAAVVVHEEASWTFAGRDGGGACAAHSLSPRARNFDPSTPQSTPSPRKGGGRFEGQDHGARQGLARICQGRKPKIWPAQRSILQTPKRASQAVAREDGRASASAPRDLEGFTGIDRNTAAQFRKSATTSIDRRGHGSIDGCQAISGSRGSDFRRWLPGRSDGRDRHGGECGREGREDQSIRCQAIWTPNDVAFQSASIPSETSDQRDEGTTSQRESQERRQGQRRHGVVLSRSLSSTCGFVELVNHDDGQFPVQFDEIASSLNTQLQAVVSTDCFTLDASAKFSAVGSRHSIDAWNQSNDDEEVFVHRYSGAHSKPSSSKLVRFAPWVECRKCARVAHQDVILPLETPTTLFWSMDDDSLEDVEQADQDLHPSGHPLQTSWVDFLNCMDLDYPWSVSWKNDNDDQLPLPAQDAFQEDVDEESQVDPDPMVDDYVAIQDWSVHQPLLTALFPAVEDPLPLVSFGIRGEPIGRRDGQLTSADPHHLAHVLWTLWQDAGAAV